MLRTYIKLFLVSIVLMASSNLISQTLITDGSYTLEPNGLKHNYNYSISQNFYEASLFSALPNNSISELHFKWDGTGAANIRCEIFMANSSQSSVNGSYNWDVTSAFTPVFNGIINTSSAPVGIQSWITVPLDVNFVYDGTSNICLMINNTSGNVHTGTFVCASSPNYQSIYDYKDLGPPYSTDPADLASTWGVWTGKRYPALQVTTVSSCTSYNITYNANGGTGTTNSTSGCLNLTVSSNSFANSGYTFTGWNTATDGTGTSYAAGATYSSSADVTLYAQWSPNAATTTGSGGNWSDGSTWSTGIAPVEGADVTIDDDIIVDVNTNSIGNLELNADVTISSSRTLSVNGTTTLNDGTSLIINGNYDANGDFDASAGLTPTVSIGSSGKLMLSSTITSLGNLSSSVGTVELDGASNQNIPVTTFNNLILNNSAGATLTGAVRVNGTLTMTSGDLTTSSLNLLTIKSSMSGSSASSHVVGPVKYTSSSTTPCTVGIGTGTLYHPVIIGALTATTENYTVEYKTGTPYNSGTLDYINYAAGVPINGSNVQYVCNDYYYDITRTGAVNANITISFSGVGISSIPSESNQYLMHYNTTTNEWEEMAVSSRGSNTVTATATSFSPFGPGSGGDALPIDLVSFTGACENNETELEFVVASQVNNDYFSIYRSANATDWNLVGEIEGAGNTSTQLTYKWIDNNPLSGVSYYKLAQTDYDGTSETFSPIAVMCEASAIDGYSVYPNPANEVLNIDLELENYQGDDVSIEVIDINGKIIQLQQVQLNRGYNHLEVDLSEVPRGVYMINFVGTRDYIKESRIIKQ